MPSVKSFRDLKVWQKPFDLAEKIYQIGSQLPSAEKFGIASQIHRAAVSIPSNIAEGASRNNRREYIQFVGIARGSAAELETQLLLLQKVYGLGLDKELQILDEVQRMLTRLSQKLRA